MKYLPFLTGVYSVAPGLINMNKATEPHDALVFHIDDNYHDYLLNKATCRQENMHKYYCEHHPLPATIQTVNNYIATQLAKEYPLLFSYKQLHDQSIFTNKKTGEAIEWNAKNNKITGEKYLSVFDALSSQVQEDLAICQLYDDDKDLMSCIHLCAPNYWSPTDKIGRPFDIVHAPVPGMEKTMPHYTKMLQSVIQKGPFSRFAWGIATDTRLNHHPIPPPGMDAVEWYGRKITDQHDLYIRTERQTIVGFPELNAFFFSIRTYFYAVDELTEEERTALWSAVRGMSPASLTYKGLTELAKVL